MKNKTNAMTARLAILYCTLLEGRFFEVRGGEDGPLQVFKTYFVATLADGRRFILDTFFVPGHYVSEDDGFAIPNRNWKREAEAFCVKVEAVGSIDPTRWSLFVEEETTDWGSAEEDRANYEAGLEA